MFVTKCWQKSQWPDIPEARYGSATFGFFNSHPESAGTDTIIKMHFKPERCIWQYQEIGGNCPGFQIHLSNYLY